MEEAMKRLVFLCFLLCGAINALAQQAAEWRPSIADDNKAATWEATADFMVNALMANGSAATKASTGTL